MNIISILIGILIATAAFFYYFYYKKRKELENANRELEFFKKEKLYYNEAMIVLSNTNEIIFANPSAKKLFALNAQNLPQEESKKIELKVDTKNPKNFFEVLREQIDSHEESFHLQNVLLVIAGKMQQVNIYVDLSMRNKEGNVTCIIDMQTVIPEEAKSNDALNSSLDFLTGLSNEFVAVKDINSMVLRSKQDSQSFSLFLLGVDHFFDLQTSLSYGYMNQVLKKIAGYLRDHLDDNMHLYKMDCNKFLIVVEKVSDDADVREIGKNIIASICNIHKENMNLHLSSSIGVSVFPEHGENATKLINNAYIALKQAQEEGDSNFVTYSPELRTIPKEETKIYEEMKAGLKNHEFFLFYQPIFDLETEEMVGAEALLRWEHPEMGLITAEKFLGIAEKSGLIIDIGAYVFKEAIRQRKLWDEIGLKKFKITLNFSLKEIQVEQFVEKLKILFKEQNVDPSDFNIDVTEEALSTNIDKMTINFKLLNELGLSISIDHFGAGASSIKHLRMLPLSSIKIDRSLIFDLSSNLEHQITVKAMISMIHDLGMEVVAEGVETTKESALLYDLGCDYAQGYLFSKPLPAAEFQALLR